MEIKVWHKIKKCWCGNPVISDGYVFENDMSFLDYDKKDSEKLELVFPTGLTCKSGQEIKSGDLVKNLIHGWHGVVKYKEGSYIVETQDGRDFRLFRKRAENLEIIGDIYEGLKKEITNG